MSVNDTLVFTKGQGHSSKIRHNPTSKLACFSSASGSSKEEKMFVNLIDHILAILTAY